MAVELDDLNVGVDLLSAEQMAALIAPVIDRLRLSSYRMTMQRAKTVAESNALERPTMMMLGYLRNLVPNRVVTRSDVQALFTYQADQEDALKPLDVIVKLGLVEDQGADRIRLTKAGCDLALQLHNLSDGVVTELWSEHARRVTTLLLLAERAVRAGAADGGQAFQLMLPPNASDAGLSPAGSLAEQLTGLRFHRFDAHIAAWRSVGLRPDQIKALKDGSARDAIEADTNRRAATPYTALTRAERLEFLAGLAALHN